MKQAFFAFATVLFATVLAAFCGGGVSAQESASCAASVKAEWFGAYDVAAEAQGDCGAATVSITITNADGAVVWSDSMPAQGLFGFEGAANAASMRSALNDWVAYLSPISTRQNMPAWPEGATEPEYREFPFMPSENLSAAQYRAVRAEDWSMICYVQGGESMRCLGENPNGGGLVDLGVQLFPG